MKKSYTYLIAAFLLLPGVTFAETQTLRTLIITITGYMNDLLFLMMGLAIVMFTWYVIQYFIKPDAERTEGAKYVMYALIGFFVLLSFWGIVNILQNTFGLKNEDNRPSSWQSFTNLFPGGGGQGYQQPIGPTQGGGFLDGTDAPPGAF